MEGSDRPIEPTPGHVPALLEETVRYLAPERGGRFVDATVGLGGHAAALLEAGPEIELLGLDRDPRALRLAAERLRRFGARVHLQQGDFAELESTLQRRGWDRVDGLLADLGVSSLQLDTPERGFSFRFEGPLDMRMGEGEMTAEQVVNRYGERELATVLREYGEERAARRIARAIVAARAERPIRTTSELRDLVHRVVGRRHGERIDPATRTFQALRIEVNRELESLDRLLEQAVELLRHDGRLVILSYHSLEDRRVKQRLRRLERGQIDPVTGRPVAETQLLEVLTRRPIRPRGEELELNPRARSARLRAARRL